MFFGTEGCRFESCRARYKLGNGRGLWSQELNGSKKFHPGFTQAAPGVPVSPLQDEGVVLACIRAICSPAFAYWKEKIVHPTQAQGAPGGYAVKGDGPGLPADPLEAMAGEDGTTETHQPR